MNWSEELRKKFGGFWNALFLIIVVIVCLRFAGAEWKASALGVRMLYALYLLMAIVALGVVFALARVGISKLSSHGYSTRSTVASDVAWGLKYGATCGASLVFVVGLLMVDNYLGPLQELLDIVLQKIADKLP